MGGKILTSRREHEMRIVKAFQLERSLVDEFRADLPMLWETFTRYAESHHGVLVKADLVFFLFDVGMMPMTPKSKLRVAVEDAIEEMGGEQNAFDSVLHLMTYARFKCKEVTNLELKAEFNA